MSGTQSQYDIGLDKTPANFVPLTPLSFLARTRRGLSRPDLDGL